MNYFIQKLNIVDNAASLITIIITGSKWHKVCITVHGVKMNEIE